MADIAHARNRVPSIERIRSESRNKAINLSRFHKERDAEVNRLHHSRHGHVSAMIDRLSPPASPRGGQRTKKLRRKVRKSHRR